MLACSTAGFVSIVQKPALSRFSNAHGTMHFHFVNSYKANKLCASTEHRNMGHKAGLVHFRTSVTLRRIRVRVRVGLEATGKMRICGLNNM